MKENHVKVKLVNLSLLSWEAPEGSSSVQKARLPDVVIFMRCNNKTIAALLHFGVFKKLKLKKNKGVWDNFITYETLGFFLNFKLKKLKEFVITFLHMKLWVFLKN
jgi:hypothetical protein